MVLQAFLFYCTNVVLSSLGALCVPRIGSKYGMEMKMVGRISFEMNWRIVDSVAGWLAWREGALQWVHYIDRTTRRERGWAVTADVGEIETIAFRRENICNNNRNK